MKPTLWVGSITKFTVLPGHKLIELFAPNETYGFDPEYRFTEFERVHTPLVAVRIKVLFP